MLSVPPRLPAATRCWCLTHGIQVHNAAVVQVLGLDITWIALLPSLVGALDYKDGSPVDYNKLLERFSSRKMAPQGEQVTTRSPVPLPMPL